jgi:hypothetical protein
MNQGKSIFSQIIDFLPKHKFRQCVNRYGGNYRVRSFTCFDQFMCMAFAQLGDTRRLKLPDDSFDVVVAHTLVMAGVIAIPYISIDKNRPV